MRIKRKLKRLGYILGVLLMLVLALILIPLIGVGIACRPWSSPAEAITAANPTGMETRPEDQTYLTLPEWYIVYSADEYAAFMREQPPSRFPYLAASQQFWQSYFDVCTITRGRYTFNSGYHLSLVVIGISFTLENMARAFYEGSIGRVSEWLSSPALTAEDHYAQQVAEEYGNFIHTIPWYQFPFDEKLAGLRRLAGQPSANPLRKWERQFALGVEYSGKGFYGRLIKGGTQAAYEPDELEIEATVMGITPEVLADFPEVEVLREVDETITLVRMPRYEAFTQLVPRLVERGVQFQQIAGNERILLSVWAPVDWSYNLSEGELHFGLPILTEPEQTRLAITVPVTALHQVITELGEHPVQLEHIYDY